MNAPPPDTSLRWIRTTDSLPPDRTEVWTKLDDKLGVRNVQTLRRRGNLWFHPDDSMYVYFTPTHWAPL